jgi:hypothetical protein
MPANNEAELDDFEEDLDDEGLEDEDGGDENAQGGGQAGGASDEDEQQARGEEGSQGQVRDQPRQVSRGENRFQRLSNENAELRRQQQETHRQLEEMRRENQRREAPAQEREPTREEMALWTPEQRMDYRLERSERNFSRMMQQTQHQAADLADKTAFDAMCQTNPRYRKYAGEVEQRLATLRSQGQTAPRDAILRYVIGEKVLASNGSPQRQRQRQQGAERVRRQQGSAAAPRSDAGTGGRQKLSDAEARAKRLENVTF